MGIGGGKYLKLLGGVVCCLVLSGCVGRAQSAGSSGYVEQVWGQQGMTDGLLQKPRAITAGPGDELYIVDMTGRIQVFTTEGKYLRGWRTPEIFNGKSSGLSFDREGNLMVADTHYFRVLFYTPEGRLLKEKTIGGVNGQGPGEFGFVTDAVQDSKGNYYVGEYGEFDRIQKFSPDREFLFEWGGHGSEPKQLLRPQNMAIDEHDHLWVADACNHRIQVFDANGATSEDVRLVRMFGEEGDKLGQLKYPYDLALDGKGHVYVCEFGNHRVQKFTIEGKPLAVWGTTGRRKGELHQPWALALDSKGRIHVLDTYNHRVQTIHL